MEERAELSPLAKILLGTLVIGLIALIFPILDILETFFTYCLIPFIFVLAVLGVSEGTIQMFQQRFMDRTMGDLRERLNSWRHKFKQEDGETIDVTPISE